MCPATLKSIAGGYTVQIPNGSKADTPDLIVSSSVFTGPSGWTASGVNTAHAEGSDLILTAYVICASVQ
jgi:hypothetical protein